MTPVPEGGLSISLARAGKIDASVFPPAVGASTTAFFPARMASPASSCTGRRLVQPRRETMASCKRGGNRAKVLMPCQRSLERHHRIALVVVGLGIVGRLARELPGL